MVPLCRFFKRRKKFMGYLPIEVQTMNCEKMDVPLEEIYGVSTFYSVVCIDHQKENIMFQFVWEQLAT